ncbi:surface-adhesin E family protein [Glaciimonas sp. PAMC28666]|uniref:surface-adhesin E family protein n=1 Tax=Glaciimonas sp. PAMC28666 TaxID=2807626 RepID=UPI001962788E|nr:surface-adhesin E family protein [Glaciimonas sp. PAMC28666]QRX81372.1 transcriptional regulator [Glaciimonas sp. PAMC28666]
MKKIALILGLTMVCIGAQATDWQVVGQSDVSSLKLDKDSIKEANGIRQVWSMWNFQEPRKNEGDPTFPTFKSYQDLTEYNCADKTTRLAREILFAENDAAGDKRDHSDALKNSKFVTPVKGSLADGIMNNFICNQTLGSK